jgi:5-formyltetrahydrofolate cyclo-ligase
MKSHELKRAKREIRGHIRAERDAIPEDERAARGARAVARLLELPEVQRAETVMAFSAFGSEVPTGPLLEGLFRRGITVCLPRIVGSDIDAVTYASGDSLRATSFGALEPESGIVVDPTEVDVVVTPGAAFDRAGRRVGYGGGFYDRLFARAGDRAFRVGLAFSMQVLGDDLPAGAFDLRVHAIVTEDEVIRCSSPG